MVRRRAAVKALLGLGLASGLGACAPLRGPRLMPAPPEDSIDPPDGEAEPDLAPTARGPVEEHDHPADGDLLVFQFGDREGHVITPDDIALGGPQTFAYPMDADSTHVATESRTDQVMLVRLDPSELSAETMTRAADGIVAYSAICTHTGCEVSEWEEESRRFRCPCHDSEFDPSDNGRVLGGPAPRRLAALPLKVVDGALIVAGGFSGRVGAQRR